MTLIRVMYGLAIIPFVVVAPFMVMLFDAPGAENSFFTQLLFWSVVCCPVTLGCSIAISLFDARGLFLPLVNVALFIVALMGIELLQGGRFTP